MSKKQPAGTTPERLMDAAETLFGQHGYSGVGMRALAQQAKVNLAAATYHFGSKKDLYLATFLRRFQEVNAERSRRLAEARGRARGEPLEVETIVECLMRPPFEMGLAHPAFSELLARTMVEPPPFLQAALQPQLQAHWSGFMSALREALPELPAPLLHLRLGLAMGPLLMLTVQIGKIPGARNPARDESVLREVVRFASSGLAGPPATKDAGKLLLPMMRKTAPGGRR